MKLYTIYEVYNHLKERRDTQRAILEVNANEPDGGSLSEDQLDLLEVETMFLTDTLAAIDHGKDLPSETELAAQ